MQALQPGERARCAIAACVLAATSVPALAQWSQCAGTAGLNMQSAHSIAGHAFVGGATGAYRSDNSGANFVSSNTGNDSVGPTRGFADDGTYLYTCTSQGVFRSIDAGASWIVRNTGLTTVLSHNILAVQATGAPASLYLVGPNGVFRSDNHADSWAPAGLAGIDVRCIAAIGGALFAGTNGSGMYKSTNGGASWTAANNGLSSTTFRAIEARGGTLFAGGQIGTGVFRSTDLGASWSLLSGGIPPSSVRGFASNDRVIVAAAFGQGAYCSVDNGNRWIAINTGLADLTLFDLTIHEGYIIAATNTQGAFRFPLSILSDLDGNGCVGAGDLAVMLGAWGPCKACAADLNGDGQVSSADLGQLLSDWGFCSNGS